MDPFNFSCSVQKYFSGESRRVRATLAELISVYATTLNNSRQLLPGPDFTDARFNWESN